MPSGGKSVCTQGRVAKPGIEFPMVAFTHCRDVVVAIAKAGGCGVLGVVGTTPECEPAPTFRPLSASNGDPIKGGRSDRISNGLSKRHADPQAALRTSLIHVRQAARRDGWNTI